jgi:hypothetical protein
MITRPVDTPSRRIDQPRHLQPVWGGPLGACLAPLLDHGSVIFAAHLLLFQPPHLCFFVPGHEMTYKCIENPME